MSKSREEIIVDRIFDYRGNTNNVIPDLIKKIEPDVLFSYRETKTTLLHLFVMYKEVDYNLLFQGKTVDCNILDGDSLSPLYRACGEPNVDIVKILLGRGALIEKAPERNPLIALCRSNIYCLDSIGVLKTLIQYGADIRIEFFADGFDYRFKHYLQNIISYSLTLFYNDMAVYNHGRIHKRGPPFIEELLNAGANVHLKLPYGRNLLHCACTFGDIETAKLLINHGCDYNLRDESGELPLHRIRNVEIRQQYLDFINAINLR